MEKMSVIEMEAKRLWATGLCEIIERKNPNWREREIIEFASDILKFTDEFEKMKKVKLTFREYA
jgi:hypothetical protein